jgi:hypothetical protein
MATLGAFKQRLASTFYQKTVFLILLPLPPLITVAILTYLQTTIPERILMVMTRFPLIVLFIIAVLFHAKAQKGWQINIMPGMAVYRGDLSTGGFTFKSLGPSALVNVNYDFGDMLVLRSGLGWGMIKGDDKLSNKELVRNRNLNFKSSIIEWNLTAQINLLDPETYYGYPYLWTGIGLFKFNPYAYDDNDKKHFLKPLSTEGQGLPEYPDRKEYALTQFFVPLGGGWKFDVKGKYALGFELGVRYLFTDYLDDVSTNYISQSVLFTRRGQTAVDMAFRSPLPINEGDVRGNPENKDFYFIGGLQFTKYLNKKKKKEVMKKTP